jgi:hypothetical protein
MPHQAHTEAGTHLDNAAKAHRTAAEKPSSKGGSAAKHSGEAHHLTEKAFEASERAPARRRGRRLRTVRPSSR